jgi:hypothetical protein
MGSKTDADAGLHGDALGRERVRCATLAPSSHNTQCWKFARDAQGRSIQRPDLVVRFGRGPVLPRLLRRPVDAVLV